MESESASDIQAKKLSSCSGDCIKGCSGEEACCWLYNYMKREEKNPEMDNTEILSLVSLFLLYFSSNLLPLFNQKGPKHLYLQDWLFHSISRKRNNTSQTLDQFQNQAHVPQPHKESPSWTCYEGERSESLTPSDVMVFRLDRLGTATLTNAPWVVKK